MEQQRNTDQVCELLRCWGRLSLSLSLSSFTSSRVNVSDDLTRRKGLTFVPKEADEFHVEAAEIEKIDLRLF